MIDYDTLQKGELVNLLNGSGIAMGTGVFLEKSVIPVSYSTSKNGPTWKTIYKVLLKGQIILICDHPTFQGPYKYWSIIPLDRANNTSM